MFSFLWVFFSPLPLTPRLKIQIISCLKNAGFARVPASKSGDLRYDPLNHWSPPAPLQRSREGSPEGPLKGFPREKHRLPPVGEPSRVAACLANEVFVDSPASSSCPFWQPSTGIDNREGGGESDSESGDRNVDVNLPRNCFTISANDVRVEFPYQRGVCCGDMEHRDVIRWLRHFCGLFVSEEDCAGREPWSCQFVEARRFDLTSSIDGDIVSTSDDGVLPDLNCAILGVSVSSAGYLSNGGSFPGLLLPVGGARSARNGVEFSERDPEFSPRPGTTMTSIPEASPYSGGSREMQTPFVGDMSGIGEERGFGWMRRSSRDRSRRRRYSMLPVSLGGTRHDANTRKRWVWLCCRPLFHVIPYHSMIYHIILCIPYHSMVLTCC